VGKRIVTGFWAVVAFWAGLRIMSTPLLEILGL